MIQLTVNPADISKFTAFSNKKVAQAEFIVSPISMSEMAKAVFVITTKKFLTDLSVAAKEEPETYHHLYEWGSVGAPSKKLFLVRRVTFQYGNLRIAIKPLKSTKPVPIASVLQEPGPTGKRVTARHIFKNKMEIMESNQPITFTTKRTIAFSPDKQQIIFVPKGKIIRISDPGGRKTTHALTNFSMEWYSVKAPLAVQQSKIMNRIVARAVRAINTPGSTNTSVYNSIREITSTYGTVSVM